MSKQTRSYLCEGCVFSAEEGVVEGKVHCRAEHKKVDAVQYKKGLRYDSCKYREGVPLPEKEISDPRRRAELALLKELARESQKIPLDEDILKRQQIISKIEARLKKKYNR